MVHWLYDHYQKHILLAAVRVQQQQRAKPADKTNSMHLCCMPVLLPLVTPVGKHSMSSSLWSSPTACTFKRLHVSDSTRTAVVLGVKRCKKHAMFLLPEAGY